MKAYLERFRAWWAGLAPRERQIFAVGSALLALMFLYLAVWEPLTGLRARREEALTEARALAVRLEQMSSAIQQQSVGGGRISGADQSLLSVVEQSAKSSLGKAPSQQPESDTSVRVRLEDVPFDAVLRWLNDLQTRYGVRVDNADIERESAAGLVNVRLTLMR